MVHMEESVEDVESEEIGQNIQEPEVKGDEPVVSVSVFSP